MADQVERIILELDNAKALIAAARTNSALEAIEKKAGAAIGSMGRVPEGVATALVSASQTTSKKIDAIVADSARKAASIGGSAIQKLEADRAWALERVKGDSVAARAVAGNYEKLIVAQRGMDQTAALTKNRAALNAWGAEASKITEKQAAEKQAAQQRFAKDLVAEAKLQQAALKQHIAGVDQGAAAYAKMGETGGGAWEKIKSGAGIAAGIAATVIAAGTAVYRFVASQTEAAEAMQNLSDRTGLTLKEVDLYSAAARSANVNVEALVGFVRRLSEALSENSEEGEKGKRALKQLGVEAYDSYWQIKPVGQLIEDIGRGLAKLPNVPAQVRTLAALGGKGASELLPIFKNLPQTLTDLRAIGYGIDDNVTKELLKADAAIDIFKRKWELLWKRAAAGLIKVKMPMGVKEALALEQELKRQERAGPFPPPPSAEAPGVPPWALTIGARQRWTAFEGGSSEIALQIRLGQAQEKLKAAIADKDVQAVRAAFSLVEALKKQNAELQKQQALVEKLGTFEFKEGDIPIRQYVPGEPEEGVPYSGEWIDTRQRSRVPSLYGRREDPLNTLSMRRALMRAQVWVERNQGMPFGGPGDQRAYAETERANEQYREKALAHQIRMVELTAGPGGEAAAVEKIYQLRVAAGKTAEDQQQAIFDRETSLFEIQRKRFDELRSSFEGLFDAAFSGARTFWDAVRRMALSVFLTPIKREMSNWVAGMLTGRGGGTAGATGGILGSFGNIFGGGGAGLGTPAYAQGYSGGGGGFGGSGGLIGSFANAYGGGYGGGGSASSAALTPVPGMIGVGMNSAGQLQTMAVSTWRSKINTQGLAGMGGMALAAGGMQRGGASGNLMTIGGGALLGYSMAAKLGMTGYGGAIAGAGAGLFAAGMQRGGWSGVGMTTAGGALVGLQYGGPIGALIGGIIGAGAGLIRSLFKTAEQKVIDKVQELYRVRIDKPLAQQIVAMAKSAFGGNLDMAIRAPQGRELIELYAMATGQNMMGLAAKQLPTMMSQSRGMLTQMPNYYGGLPYVTPVGSTTGLGGGGSSFSVSLDPDATREFLSGRMATAITSNPRAVATASLEAGRQSFNRREIAAQSLQPGLVLA